jgi:hypothetical protein
MQRAALQRGLALAVANAMCRAVAVVGCGSERSNCNSFAHRVGFFLYEIASSCCGLAPSQPRREELLHILKSHRVAKALRTGLCWVDLPASFALSVKTPAYRSVSQRHLAVFQWHLLFQTQCRELFCFALLSWVRQSATPLCTVSVLLYPSSCMICIVGENSS